MAVNTCLHPTVDGSSCTHLVDSATPACAAGHPNPHYQPAAAVSTAQVAAPVVGDVESILASAATGRRKVPKGEGTPIREANGDVVYRYDGRPHRLDGPAYISASGFQGWFHHGDPHRLDGPAELWPDGTRRWLRNGLLDRADGPAIEVGWCDYCGPYWWDSSNPKSKPDWREAADWQGPPYGPGTWEWYRQGRRHREDGPAAFIVVNKPYEYLDPHDGSHHTVAPHTRQEWWVDGKLHREDGPAVVTSTGKETWYRHGKIHREDGPAITYPDGRLEWWRHGRNVGSPAERRFDGWWRRSRRRSRRQR